MFGEEALDSRKRRHESAGEVWKRSGADNDQQGNAIPHDRVAFVRLIANATIVGYRNPAMFAHNFKPRSIRCVWREVIRVSLDVQAA